MKNILVIFILLLLAGFSFAEQINISSEDFSVTLLSSSESETVIEYIIGSFEREEIDIEGQTYYELRLANEVSSFEKDCPALPFITRSLIIPDNALMQVNVLESEYVEFNMPVLPSKGILSRTLNPEDVPYNFSEIYQTDNFYPETTAVLGEPYIMRDYRGITIKAQPFTYNPVKNTLRVYTRLVLKVSATGVGRKNVKSRTAESRNRYFSEIYRNHFLNYKTTERYDTVEEQGRMIIISYGDFMDVMQPLVDWKNQKGLQCDMYDVGEIGANSTSISNFIQDEYNLGDGLTFVLLVGDAAHIPSNGENQDPTYGCLEGTDFYPEIFISRFSAEIADEVDTQVERTIYYERDIIDGDWLHKGLGIASDLGPDEEGEFDDEHMDIIRDKLLAYTYTEVDQQYDSNGGSIAGAMNTLNEGVSIVNYAGHGLSTHWSSGAPLHNNNVNELENDNMLPFIHSCACYVGNFTNLNVCFAEVWLRATNNLSGIPTGAIAFYGSTNSPTWSPPGRAQDHAIDLLVGWNYYTNEEIDQKFTIGGLWFNGSCNMMDVYGDPGINVFTHWTIFGDASLLVRTDTPTEIEAVYQPTLLMEVNTFDVDAGVDNAQVCLSYENQILGSGYTDESGMITLDLENVPTILTDLTLTITATNKITFIDNIPLVPNTGPFVVIDSYQINDGDNQLADYGETFSLDLTLFNAGNLASGEVTITAVTEDQELSILSGNFSVDNIDAGDYFTVQEAINLQLSDSVPDHHEAQITFWASGINTWQSEIQLLCNAPDFITGTLQVIDGDNGVLDPGETVDIQIPLTNIGHAMSEDIEAQLTCLTSDVLEITDPAVDIEGLESGELVLVEFTVSVFEDLEPGTAIEFIFQAVSGEYSVMEEYITSVGNIVENFEEGNFLSYPWIHEGDQNWAITENAFEGDFAAVSGSIGDNEISSLKIEFTIPFDGHFSFWKKVSSQAESDIFSLRLDYDQIAAWSGEIDWSQEILEITAGEHVLEWQYTKDQNGTAGEDKAWLDQIVFPSAGITFPPMLTIMPTELNIELSNIDQYETEIQVLNIGGSELTFNATVPGTLDWLTLSEYSGTLTSGTATNISVYIDALDLENGEYTGAIFFNCDIPDFVFLPVFLIINNTGSEDDLPVKTELLGNYPNPFNPTTTISFQLSANSSQEDVELKIYNIKGQKVKTFNIEDCKLNINSVVWNGHDESGRSVSSGIYFYKLKAGKEVQTRKMILLK